MRARPAIQGVSLSVAFSAQEEFYRTAGVLRLLPLCVFTAILSLVNNAERIICANPARFSFFLPSLDLADITPTNVLFRTALPE